MNKGFINILIILAIAVAIVVVGYEVTGGHSRFLSMSRSSPYPTPTATISITPTVTAQIKSGISGTVMAGPTCPVSRPPIDGNPGIDCGDKPYQGDFVVKIYDGVTTTEFARFSTDVDGKYSIKLPPGDYIIESAMKVGIMTQPEYVTVRPNEVKKFDFTLDTGIR